MCGTIPSGHCAENRVSISVKARSRSICAQPSATRQESQFHWNGYSPAVGTV